MFRECRTLFRLGCDDGRRGSGRPGARRPRATSTRPRSAPLIDAAFVVMRRTGVDRPAGARHRAKPRACRTRRSTGTSASKDALLLAVLADGQRQLVAYLAAPRSRRRPTPRSRCERWIDGVHGAGARPRTPPRRPARSRSTAPGSPTAFPDEVAASRRELLDLAARPRCTRSAATTRDVEFVHDLTMSHACTTALVARRRARPRRGATPGASSASPASRSVRRGT